MTRQIVSVLAFMVLVFALPSCNEATSTEGAVTEPLHIEISDGQLLSFNVEMALTPAEQTKGLMFREEMAEDAGMLFVFPNVAPRSFWMKNTLIPLDMIFIGQHGNIVHVHSNAIPGDLTGVKSVFPAKAVLEINGGLSAKLGILPGHKVHHEAFSNILAE